MDIKFQFQLNMNVPKEIEPEYAAYKHGYIEGEMKIWIDEQCFFSEPYINLVEIGFQLGDWYQQILKGKKLNLMIKTIDHDDSILNFTYQTNEKWVISSVWQIFECETFIHTDILLVAKKLSNRFK